MKPALQLKISQHLALTPQLQQSIKLLQLSTVEMQQEIERYLAENPLLERADEEEGGAFGHHDNAVNWEIVLGATVELWRRCRACGLAGHAVGCARVLPRLAGFWLFDLVCSRDLDL